MRPQTVEQAADLFRDGELSYEQLRSFLQGLSLPAPQDDPEPPTSFNELYLRAEKSMFVDDNSLEWLAVLEMMGLITDEQLDELCAAARSEPARVR